MKKNLSEQEAILKRAEIATPSKFNLNAANGNFIFKFNLNSKTGKVLLDKNYFGKIEDLFKNSPDRKVLTEIMIEHFKERIADNPRKAMTELPLAFLELPSIKESFDQNLGKVYTRGFAKLFGIKLVDEKTEQEVDEVRRDIFANFKQDKRYVPGKDFEDKIVSRMKTVTENASLQEIYSSVASTQKYCDLMTMQVSDACAMGSRLYHLYHNRDQEAIKSKEIYAQA